MRENQRNASYSARTALRPQGADLHPDGGVRHRLWAPTARSVEAVVLDERRNETVREMTLEKEDEGFYSVRDTEGRPGNRYKYRIDGDLFPDPFSRWQPDDVSDASMVINPAAYEWRVAEWERVPLSRSVIYELHIGTFTSEGTFLGAIERLDYLVDLGVTTIEIMPVAAFAGRRNWGYDGAMLFAPDSSYGHPDDLRALVDAAHKRGLNVLLDVVYNHFGPDGNYLASFSPHYFNPELKTPWGDAINFSGKNSRHVRSIFLANVAYWLDEFRIDGVRLDATHEILDDSTPHILADIANTVHERGALVIAEDDRNLAALTHPQDKAGMGIDGLWADDFHHTVRVALTGRREGYFANFKGTPQELAETLHNGWLYCGQVAPATAKHRGTPTKGLRLEQFIHCISNHDQTGNHAFGKRLGHLISPAAYRAASALMCMTPGTPLLFMGQEWNASTPFLYFTDHHDELGRLVTAGRRREFKDFIEAIEGESIEKIPDPQEELTFIRSQLQWDEPGLPSHEGVLILYRELLKLRMATPAIQKRNRGNCGVDLLGDGVIGIRFTDTAHSGLILLADIHGNHRCRLDGDRFASLPPGWIWRRFLSTNEQRFGGEGSSVSVGAGGTEAVFTSPEAILLEPTRTS